MPSSRSLQSWIGVLLLGGGLAVALPGLVVVPDLLHTEYTHEVTPASPDVPDTPENDTNSPPVFEFENLSTAGQTAVRGATNASDGTFTVGADGRAPEFTYDNDVATVQYVADDGEYKQVTTVQEDRLGEAIGVGAILIGGVMVVLGVGLWRRDRHTG